MTARWPGALLQRWAFLAGSSGFRPDRNFREFAVDQGPAKRRRQVTQSGGVRSAAILATVPVERDAFWYFYTVTLGGGVLPFTAPDPWDRDRDRVWRFESVSETELTPGTVRLDLNLREMPAT